MMKRYLLILCLILTILVPSLGFTADLPNTPSSFIEAKVVTGSIDFGYYRVEARDRPAPSATANQRGRVLLSYHSG